MHSYTHTHTEADGHTDRLRETFYPRPPDPVKRITQTPVRLLCIVAERGHCLCVNNLVCRADLNRRSVFICCGFSFDPFEGTQITNCFGRDLK